MRLAIFGALIFVVLVLVHGLGTDIPLWFAAGYMASDLADAIEDRFRR